MKWKGDWIIKSAGTWASPGAPALPVAIIAARKLGMSLDGHKVKSITPELVSTQNLILVMESGQKEALQNEFSPFANRVFLLSEVAQNKIEEIADPVMSDADSYIETAFQINNMIETGFYRICGFALKTSVHYVKIATEITPPEI